MRLQTVNRPRDGLAHDAVGDADSFRDSNYGTPVRCPRFTRTRTWSQNLGHEGLLTTLTGYGAVAPDRQAELIRRMGRPRVPASGLAGPIALGV